MLADVFQHLSKSQHTTLRDGAACTKFEASTFPSYASFARVLESFVGRYAGQFSAGDEVGSLMKFAIAVWNVTDSVRSFADAEVWLYVPKSWITKRNV